MNLLEVRDLRVHYGKLPALEGVDLDVPEGSVVAILGPNGAGKSTLLRAIAGLVTPTSGTVMLRGEPVTGLPANQLSRSGVCLVPEGRGIFPNLTVADNLRVALGADPGRRERTLEHFPRLAERLGQRAGTLSGGEQQMLALARAVGADPLVLMADELSLGLAPMLVGSIFDTLRRLHEEEARTIVLVEQYATHALALADSICILSRGRAAWSGTPDELRASDALVDTYLGGAA